MQVTRRHFCGLTCSTLALGATGCAVNPATGESGLMLVSSEQERRIGAEEHPKIIKEFGGVYDDPRVAGYAASIGGRLAQVTEQPETSYTFTVLDNPIVNAFALPGGYVYITRGLMALAENEAELAGVLGHEIGHVVARHSSQRRSTAILAQIGAGLLGAATGSSAIGNLAATGAGAYLRSFSRDQELEADRLGVRYLSRAGYDPGAMSSFLAKMRANSRLDARIAGRDPDSVDEFDFMASHPRTQQRVQQALQLAGASAGRGTIGRDQYLQRIDAMIYGDSPEQGYARGSEFLHPVRQLAFRVPDGFHLRNMPDKVAAVSERNVLILFDQEADRVTVPPDRYIAEDWARGRDLTNLQTGTLNGLDAATAHTTIDASSERLLARVAAIHFGGGRVYRFLAVAPGGASAPLDSAFRQTVSSFRRLTPAEAAALRPWRIRIVPVQPGDTIQGLARRMPFKNFGTERFEVLNGLGGGRTLVAGTRVKLVAE